MPHNIVVYPDKEGKLVKNLGWLLRHRPDGIKEARIYPDGGSNAGGAWLVVDFDNGSTFYCEFASLSVCRDWAARFLVKRAWVSKVNEVIL